MRVFFIKIKWIAVLFFAVALCLCATVTVAVTAANVRKSAAYTVVIDAGHGGVDGGVVGSVTGVKESDLNLEMAEELASYFKKAGVNVVFTRKNKGGLYDGAKGNFKLNDFKKRKEIILSAEPDIVVSIHMNFYKAASYRRGAQVFFNPVNGDSRILAHTVQNKLNENINQKYTGRGYGCLAGDYYIINSTPYPSVIVECGFLSNAADEKLLTDKNYQKEFCYHLFSACMSYLFTN